MDVVARLPLNQPSTPAQGQQADAWLALVHVEVEARDNIAPLRPRMFVYYRDLRRKYALPVLPVGLYLRVGLDGIGWDVYEEWFWEHRLLHFEYAYVGLPALDAVNYVQGNNWLGVALAALMRVPAERRVELKAEAVRRLATSSLNAYKRYLLCECVESYWPLEGSQLEAYQHLLLTKSYEEAWTMVSTTYQQMVEKGRQEGSQRLIVKLLQRRFGALSEKVTAKLAELPEERLTEIGEALLTAQSLRELGLDE